ncbi:hypothetical protein [Hyphomicrobium sp.]|jgi:hypothetical protein|uniref:hypothetical protein n=1 Tax=Hyphomicrobium sp. TaxID=82 RepID=UPI002CED97A7|nr:hypothetical protein [Hyphomicrobium sp.]HVZ03726.1 hypothetical protein [Hyphomicrobium sp.]
MPFFRFSVALVAAWIFPAIAAHATKPKLDEDTCAQLRLEQSKFLKTGILSDMAKGPDWAKAHLSADRLQEIKHYITLDEQVRFGCRDAKLSADAEKASKAAARIEINSDADPIAPVVKDPVKPGAKPEAKKKPRLRKHISHKKSKKLQKSGSLERPHGSGSAAASVSAAAESGGGEPQKGSSDGVTPKLPAFGFGETVVLPHDAP